VEPLLPIIITVVLLSVGYVAGTITENRHFEALRRAEHDSRDMIVITFSKPPSDWNVHDPALVTGSVVSRRSSGDVSRPTSLCSTERVARPCCA